MNPTAPEIAALVGAALAALAASAGWWAVHRRARRLRAALADETAAVGEERRRVVAAERRLTAAAIAESEAGWSARALAGHLARSEAALTERDHELRTTVHQAEAGERQIDDLRSQLLRLESELQEARRVRDADATRLVEIETELIAAGGEINRLRLALDERSRPTADDDSRVAAARAEAARLGELVTTLEAALEAERRRHTGGLRPVPDERDAALARLARETEDAHRVAATARTEIERLTAELTRVRSDADLRVAAALASVQHLAPAAPVGEPEARLIQREAEIRDLEERLAVLTAARNAELRRLNERIAGLERLYLEIEARDHRIAELELELKDAAETLEGVRAEAVALESRLADAIKEVEAVRRSAADAEALRKGLGEAHRRLEELETQVLRSRGAGAELDQLRAMLSAERERNVRLVRRAALETRPGLADAIAAATRPLQDTIARLEAALAALTAAPLPGPTDDVTLIRGIGPKIAALLARQGITSLRQIAAFTDADIARIGPLLPVYAGRIVDDAWVDQARRLIGEVSDS